MGGTKRGRRENSDSDNLEEGFLFEPSEKEIRSGKAAASKAPGKPVAGKAEVIEVSTESDGVEAKGG
jgi:hypothetical protein